jgi:hypothetical protein
MSQTLPVPARTTVPSIKSMALRLLPDDLIDPKVQDAGHLHVPDAMFNNVIFELIDPTETTASSMTTSPGKLSSHDDDPVSLVKRSLPVNPDQSTPVQSQAATIKSAGPVIISPATADRILSCSGAFSTRTDAVTPDATRVSQTVSASTTRTRLLDLESRIAVSSAVGLIWFRTESQSQIRSVQLPEDRSLKLEPT